MSDSEASEEDLPSGEECQKASEEFATITGTDTALAMFYLQDVKWKLEPAINNFFRDQETSSSSSSTTPGLMVVSGKGQNSDSVAIVPTGKRRPSSSRESLPAAMPASSSSNAAGVCTEIEREDPDAVFLQEVVPESLTILESKMTNYKCVQAGGEGYFVVILLKKATAAYEDHCIEAYGQSRMGRNLLMVKCRIRNIPVLLLTSHLESMKNHEAERKRQLKICFNNMTNPPDPKRVVIFGGDLNLRDTELASIGGTPSGVIDVWEAAGKRKEAQFTWDMSLNDNKEMPAGAKFKCRCRFDRLYLRQPAEGPPKFKPVYFELAGIQRLKDCRRFCSDHWGILAHLDIL